MAAVARMRVDGLKQFDGRLARLPIKLQRTILRDTMKDASKPMVRAAKALAPRETGLLRRSIAARIRSYRRGQSWVAIIGPRKVGAPKFREGLPRGKAARDPSAYGHLVEKGTKPHTQRGVTIPAVYIRLFTSQHPGTSGTGFMESAWDANRMRVLRRLKRRLFVDIGRALQTL